MQKNYTQLVTGIIIGLILGLLIGRQVFVTSPIPNTHTTTPSLQGTNESEHPRINNTGKTYKQTDIPQKVYDVLKYVRANNHAMEGYAGGRIFTNREKIVPQADAAGNKIKYQEWDVNPKIPGQNRGSERILTGSDGRAWYTDDHYQSFKEIK